MNAAMQAFCASRGWPADLKLAFRHAVERAQEEIINDVRWWRVPYDCPDFAALHDYVDANEYGWGFDDPLPVDDDEFHRFGNSVQDALNQWVASGRMRQEATPCTNCGSACLGHDFTLGDWLADPLCPQCRADALRYARE